MEGAFGVLTMHMLASTYTRAVRSAGGVPVVIPTHEGVADSEILDWLDGLILTGGGDVDPALYGGTQHSTVHGVDPSRDQSELSLARLARERQIPVLGICRGLQVVNVAFGGDLVVDIASHVTGDVVHRMEEPGEVATHPVRVLAASELARNLPDELLVNSSHHQAARGIGEGLRAVAWAADGVVEAIDATDHGWWYLGVQWHPEQRPPNNVSSSWPFEALLLAAEEYRKRRHQARVR